MNGLYGGDGSSFLSICARVTENGATLAESASPECARSRAQRHNKPTKTWFLERFTRGSTIATLFSHVPAPGTGALLLHYLSYSNRYFAFPSAFSPHRFHSSCTLNSQFCVETYTVLF